MNAASCSTFAYIYRISLHLLTSKIVNVYFLDRRCGGPNEKHYSGTHHLLKKSITINVFSPCLLVNL